MNILKGIDTFYPFHNHAIPEIYYTIREPACAEEFLNFAIRENNPLLETVSETDTMREVEFDGSDEECDYIIVYNCRFQSLTEFNRLRNCIFIEVAFSDSDDSNLCRFHGSNEKDI